MAFLFPQLPPAFVAFMLLDILFDGAVSPPPSGVTWDGGQTWDGGTFWSST